ncbi:hypothetical protein BWD42_24265 [Sphingobacterium sp. CZ-UAM]|uniref:glycosyltransferase n=1 Tax=Sphingobacterium sp. CZ-UAM TaxID=1933868 RepID=UPI0009848C04|nr:glycosyltransferase [Sphingobacterium sp. CZ-UAM]OOG15668.1 hypothetical protein BWD42_24265 [Sphingobacterium sp. CZ-UAM]
MENKFSPEQYRERIVFIITDYGSFNNFLGELAVEMARRSITVSIICSPEKVIKIEDKYDYEKEGIEFFYVDFPRGFNIVKHIFISNQIKRILHNISPSFVFIHFTTGMFTTTFTGRLRYKTAGMFHGVGYSAVDGVFKRWMYKFIEKRCIRRIDDVWVLNKSDKDLLNIEFPKKNINLLRTAGLGCDLNRFDPSKFSSEFKNQLRSELDINEKDIVIAFTGRFVFFKGFGKLVRAFLQLIEKNHIDNIKLLLIGDEDSAHRTGLHPDEVARMKACKNIKTLGFRSDVENFLSISDLFVFPSEKEGMPVCIIEALAMGVPVITNNSRGCNDLVENLVNGIVLEKNTPEDISAAIQKLINDSALYDAIKTNILQNRLVLARENFVSNQLNYILENLA